ncbi:MAG: acetate/propionate family kinase [Gammaproteobacteria bacterium]|nr:acetate/propionate family kinase [Gammaproteobacteria bacterium]MCP5424384.1 acetate/propionate family kinase [Gammaproteobacteria bacterium]
MNGGILVINAGSSSIKFSLFDASASDALTNVAKGQVEGIGVHPHFIAKTIAGEVLAEHDWDDAATDRAILLRRLLDWINSYLGGGGRLRAVGHRVVFGGERYQAPVRVTPDVLQALIELIPLVPLHQPANLAPIQALAQIDPELPQIACFDTAFHGTVPRLARTYGLPRSLTEEGVQGYGFHGLSYEYIAGELPRFDPQAAQGRAVVAHLGSGASLCALVRGKSTACTLGFSALDGLLMGTRPGHLDPGVLLYLLMEKQLDAKALEHLLYQESGLLGVSGISNDMRDLLSSTHPHAQEAVDLFVYRAARELGSIAAAAGGLDALIFTAGVGENAAPIRAGICQQAAWLGVELDTAANQAGGPRISTASSRVGVWVIPTNEELMIARHSIALV